MFSQQQQPQHFCYSQQWANDLQYQIDIVNVWVGKIIDCRKKMYRWYKLLFNFQTNLNVAVVIVKNVLTSFAQDSKLNLVRCIPSFFHRSIGLFLFEFARRFKRWDLYHDILCAWNLILIQTKQHVFDVTAYIVKTIIKRLWISFESNQLMSINSA